MADNDKSGTENSRGSTRGRTRRGRSDDSRKPSDTPGAGRKPASGGNARGKASRHDEQRSAKPGGGSRPPQKAQRHGRNDARRSGGHGGSRGDTLLYGLHAVAAALRNPRRQIRTLYATGEGMERLGDLARKPGLSITPLPADELARRLPRDAVHQGVALDALPLPPLALDRVIAIQPAKSLVLALDQVTDPRNLGAILRAAAAFGVNAVIVPERRSAELNGAAARAAAGAIDIVPIVQVVNLSRALERLKQAGFWVMGLDGDGERTLGESSPGDRRVLVLGSEGSGIRRLVGETCDEIIRIRMDPRMESLNVATAAAVALYELGRR